MLAAVLLVKTSQAHDTDGYRKRSLFLELGVFSRAEIFIATAILANSLFKLKMSKQPLQKYLE